MRNSILQQIKQYKKVFILAPVFMIISGLLETMIPLMTTRIVDYGIQQSNINEVLRWGGYMLIFAVSALVTALIGYIYSARASSGLAANLREALFKKIQGFSFSNLDKYGVSGLVTRETTDVNNIQTAAQTILTTFFKTPVAVVYSLLLTVQLNRRLSLVLVIGVVIIGVFLSIIIIRSIVMYRKVYEDYDGLNGRIQENVTGIRVVKSFAKEKAETESFEKQAGMVKTGFIKVERLLAFNNPVMMMSLEFCFIGIAWIGAKYISVGDMSVGDLTGFITYAFQIMTYMAMMVLSFVMLSSSFASIKRVQEVLNEEPGLVFPEGPSPEMEDGSVVFSNVSFRYGEGNGKNVLDNIDISIGSGEMVGIVGATGSSKTSLINLVSRLYDATEGRVYVGKRDVKEYDADTLTDNIAVVLQKNVLFSGTVEENLKWGKPGASIEECEEACRLACADAFIKEKEGGFGFMIEQGGANLSGGQRQRLCLARALIKKPSILILDDALSALDTATESKIRTYLKEDMPEMTKLIITQRVGSVREADRILVLHKGRVCGFDTHENLIESCEVYRDLCAAAEVKEEAS
ncbi:MAG: ABC transporter ATP-binding protein/permease [Lachnospiraceae bacterium]|nr:ABC transporter ATP-binding protein/permease [Lachnospiraceae bacterium]